MSGGGGWCPTAGTWAQGQGSRDAGGVLQGPARAPWLRSFQGSPPPVCCLRSGCENTCRFPHEPHAAAAPVPGLLGSTLGRARSGPGTRPVDAPSPAGQGPGANRAPPPRPLFLPLTILLVWAQLRRPPQPCSLGAALPLRPSSISLRAPSSLSGRGLGCLEPGPACRAPAGPSGPTKPGPHPAGDQPQPGDLPAAWEPSLPGPSAEGAYVGRPCPNWPRGRGLPSRKHVQQPPV